MICITYSAPPPLCHLALRHLPLCYWFLYHITSSVSQWSVDHSQQPAANATSGSKRALIGRQRSCLVLLARFNRPVSGSVCPFLHDVHRLSEAGVTQSGQQPRWILTENPWRNSRKDNANSELSRISWEDYSLGTKLWKMNVQAVIWRRSFDRWTMSQSSSPILRTSSLCPRLTFYWPKFLTITHHWLGFTLPCGWQKSLGNDTRYCDILVAKRRFPTFTSSAFVDESVSRFETWLSKIYYCDDIVDIRSQLLYCSRSIKCPREFKLYLSTQW